MTVYGVIENPWLALTVEFLKVFTLSGVWSSAMSYIGDTYPVGSTAPSFVHMLYWGIGYGGGGMLGGVLMDMFGARTIFLGLAIISLIVVILILVIVHVNCCPMQKESKIFTCPCRVTMVKRNTTLTNRYNASYRVWIATSKL